MNPELLGLIKAGFESGKFKTEADFNRWLAERGLDEYGKPVSTGPGTFRRGLNAALPSQVFGTTERLSRAFDILTPGSLLGSTGFTEAARKKSMENYELEGERAAIGTAPRPRLPLARNVQQNEGRGFTSGAMAGELAGEVGKLGAVTYAAKKAVPWLAEAFAPALAANPYTAAAVALAAPVFSAVEDVGTLPEESVGYLAGEFAGSRGHPGVERALKAMARSTPGRAALGATLGLLPEAIWKTGKAARGFVRDASETARVLRQGRITGTVPTPNAPKVSGDWLDELLTDEVRQSLRQREEERAAQAAQAAAREAEAPIAVSEPAPANVPFGPKTQQELDREIWDLLTPEARERLSAVPEGAQGPKTLGQIIDEALIPEAEFRAGAQPTAPAPAVEPAAAAAVASGRRRGRRGAAPLASEVPASPVAQAAEEIPVPPVGPAVAQAAEAVPQAVPTAPRTPAQAVEEFVPSGREERQARSIIEMWKVQDASAKTKARREFLAKQRIAQKARLAGTRIGKAIERLGVPLAVGAATVGAANAATDDRNIPGASLAGSALLAGMVAPGMGRGLLRTMGRTVNPVAESFLGGVYSRLESAIAHERLPERMLGRDWANSLKGEFVDATSQTRFTPPRAEVEWTGLGRFLDENADRTLSRDDVADYLANNRLELQETRITPHNYQDLGESLYGFEGRGKKPSGQGFDATTKIAGRSNYRDVVFTFKPVGGNRNNWVGPHYAMENPVLHVRMFDVDMPNGKTALFVQEIQSDLHQIARKAGGYANDEFYALERAISDAQTERMHLNTVAGVLSDNRVKNIADLPDIASQGTRPTTRAKMREDAAIWQEAIDFAKSNGLKNLDDIESFRNSIRQRIDDLKGRQQKIADDSDLSALEQVPPSAPFSSTEDWTDLGIRRVLDEATKGGYDEVIFANGPQVTAATKGAYIHPNASSVTIQAHPQSETVVISGFSGKKKLKVMNPAFDSDGFGTDSIILSDAGAAFEDVNAARKLFGKYIGDSALVDEIAQALVSGKISSLGEDGTSFSSRTPFTFGDRSLFQFYDQTIPSRIKKYLKSLDASVEFSSVKLPLTGGLGLSRTTPNLTVKLTPKIRQSVSAGQRLMGAALTAGGIGAAAASEAEAQDGRPQEARMDVDVPTLLAVGAGAYGLRRMFGRMAAAKAAAIASRAERVDLAEIARLSAATERTAAAEERAAQRIREPVSPRAPSAYVEPNDAFDVFKFANRLAGDPEAAVDVQNLTNELIESGRVDLGGKIPWSVEREAAEAIGASPEELATRDPSRMLSAPELMALRDVYVSDAKKMVLLKDVMRGGSEYSDEERALASRLYEVLDSRRVKVFQRMRRDEAEAGRVLNSLKEARRSSTDPSDWLMRAQKLAGGQELSLEETKQIIGAIENGEFIKARAVISRIRARNASMFDKAAEFFQTALLSRFGRFFRDIAGNSLNRIDNEAKYAIAGKIDQLLAGMGVFKGRSMGGSVSQIRSASKSGARRGWEQAIAILKGENASPEQLIALERASKRYDFSNESLFENPYLRAYAQFIRRTIGAADQPFYEAGFAMSIETQARAIGENMGLRGASLDEFVASKVAKPTPEMTRIAIEEGSEAVWQNETSLGKAAAALGMRGSKNPIARFGGKLVLPFAQTPSGITTQTLSQSPLGLVGAIPDAIAARAGVAGAQRKLVRKLAGVSTGAAWIGLGYMLADDGKMTSFYPDDPNERARWAEENKLPNAILIGGKWVSLSGLLGPQAQLMAIGASMRKLVEEDSRSIVSAGAEATTLGVGRTLLDSPTMQGAEAIMSGLQAMGSEDPEARSEAGAKMLSSYAGGFVPGIVQQLASMGDTDPYGRIIMRDPSASDTFLGDLGGALAQGIPGLRSTLPEKISPFGRTRTGGGGGLLSLVSPLRTSQSYATPLTEALDDIGYFPIPSRRRAGEDVQQYNTRRKSEGRDESAFLEALLSNDPTALRFITDNEMRQFNETGDEAELVRAALKNYRAARSRANRNQ